MSAAAIVRDELPRAGPETVWSVRMTPANSTTRNDKDEPGREGCGPHVARSSLVPIAGLQQPNFSRKALDEGVAARAPEREHVLEHGRQLFAQPLAQHVSGPM